MESPFPTFFPPGAAAAGGLPRRISNQAAEEDEATEDGGAMLSAWSVEATDGLLGLEAGEDEVIAVEAGAEEGVDSLGRDGAEAKPPRRGGLGGLLRWMETAW